MTRLSVNINDECAAVVRDAMEDHDITATEVIRQALSAYKFVQDHRDAITAALELRAVLADADLGDDA